VTARPFVKTVGGKRKLVPAIRELVPPSFNCYFEPFVGGGALFFDLLPERATLVDLNLKLIVVYRELRDHPEAVIAHLRTLENTRECFDRIRARNFDRGTLSERAAEYIFCNKVGFNGLYRENRSGQFNTPFGRYDNPTICDEENLRAVSAALQGVFLWSVDFHGVEQHVHEDDLVYFDPPYAPVSKTSNFVGYTRFSFTDEDQKNLRDLALRLKRDRGAHVILSNSCAPIIRELYAGPDWTVREVSAARSINSDAEKRGAVTELLIT
jgi:DNA adenine methylase